MQKSSKKPISKHTAVVLKSAPQGNVNSVQDGDLTTISAVGPRTPILTEALTATTFRNFYLIVTPGFEEQAAAELKDWLPNLAFTVGRGGIEFTTSLGVGCELNRVLKTPTRILVRLADYGCRDFPKLFKKMSAFPWHEWVSDGTPIEFHATSRSSRLAIKKRIEETCLDGRRAAIKKRGAVGNASLPAVTVYVRFEDDICWVSLDTSGEILHKRGLRPLSSNAPLRETMAANLLRYLESFGLGVNIELVDPMTGGGTFLMEAVLARKKITSRNFAFENFVVRTEENFRAQSKDPYIRLVGFESDAKTLRAAAENLSSISGNSEEQPVELIDADFFEAQALPVGPKRWLIANPPYGERIRVEGKLSDFYERLFVACAEKVAPERALFILPEKVNPPRLRLPDAWQILGEKRFLNGGLPVFAMVYGLKPESKAYKKPPSPVACCSCRSIICV